ncbi:MAG TPA: nuclear transport factor 2 family protein [Thermoanaerobaculia bacterium]|jgi:hypothetical protein
MRDAVNELNALVRDKRLVEGIERFYADEVVMEESSSQAMEGRIANRDRERVFQDGLTRWDARLESSVVDEESGLAFNRWTIEYDHSTFGPGVLRQVAAQQWRDGKVVRETFYKI